MRTRSSAELAPSSRRAFCSRRRREGLGIGDIGDDHRPDADVTRRRERRLRSDAHVDDRGRAGQQRLRIGRERADIGLLVGELRLLALDDRQPTFERQALGAAARETGMGMGVRVDQAGKQAAPPPSMTFGLRQPGAISRCRPPRSCSSSTSTQPWNGISPNGGTISTSRMRTAVIASPRSARRASTLRSR